jgi:hypothetical protein
MGDMVYLVGHAAGVNHYRAEKGFPKLVVSGAHIHWHLGHWTRGNFHLLDLSNL